jgi:hypothetical protein
MSCWSFTVPADTDTFEIDIHNTPLSKIIVDKVTLPSGSVASFDFTPTGYGAPFSLTDAAAPNDSGFIAGGNYSVAEAAKLHWDLTLLNCTSTIPAGGAGTSSATYSGETVADPLFHLGDTTANIALQAGATVTCTYTNTQHGHVIIVKNTVNGCGDFSYTSTGGNGLTSPFSLATCPADATPNSDSHDFEVKPGAFTVTEGALPLDLTGTWHFTSLSCADTTGTDSTPNETPSTTIQVATINVSPGETVTCTYVNTLVVPAQYCSPGFWKQPQHFGWYLGTGVDPWAAGATQYDDIFTHAPLTYNGDPYGTLIFPYMIGSGGGGLWMLGRTCAASYLDAASPDLPGYPLSPGAVQTLCNNAYDGGVGSAAFNTAVQELGAVAIENCPLGTKTVDDGPDSNGWGSIKP